MDIKKFKAWAESKNLSTDGETGRNYSYTFYDPKTQAAWDAWKEVKAQAVPEGFILVSAEQLSQWGHMANCAEEYGCPECFEARGYAHSLACEINEFFAIEAQEPAK